MAAEPLPAGFHRDVLKISRGAALIHCLVVDPDDLRQFSFFGDSYLHLLIRLSDTAIVAQSSTWLTKPSASLGSNQVDLGGMTSPASATDINASMLVG